MVGRLKRALSINMIDISTSSVSGDTRNRYRDGFSVWGDVFSGDETHRQGLAFVGRGGVLLGFTTRGDKAMRGRRFRNFEQICIIPIFTSNWMF